MVGGETVVGRVGDERHDVLGDEWARVVVEAAGYLGQSFGEHAAHDDAPAEGDLLRGTKS